MTTLNSLHLRAFAALLSASLLALVSCQKRQTEEESAAEHNCKTRRYVSTQKSDFLERTLRRPSQIGSAWRAKALELTQRGASLEATSFMEEWLRAELHEATQYLVEEEIPETLRPWLYDGFLNYLNTLPLSDALPLLAEHPFNASLSLKSLENLLPRWLYEQPATAQRWLAERGEWEFAPHAYALAGSLSGSKHDRDALIWIEQLAEPGRAAALTAALKEMRKRNPDLAADILNEQIQSAALDEAVYAATEAVLGESPAAAMTWATSLQEKNLQRSAILEVANQWVLSDREAYLTWVEEGDFDQSLYGELPPTQ